MRYAIVIEKTSSHFSAYVPDLPGCIATGTTIPETEGLIRDAIAFHLEGLKADSLPIPVPSSHPEYIDIRFPIAPQIVKIARPDPIGSTNLEFKI